MRYVISDLTDAVELLDEFTTIDGQVDFLPALLVLQQLDILSKRQVGDVLHDSLRIGRIAYGRKFLGREVWVDQLADVVLDVSQEYKRLSEYSELLADVGTRHESGNPIVLAVADLKTVIDAWSTLPGAVKAGILAMIRAAGDAN